MRRRFLVLASLALLASCAERPTGVAGTDVLDESLTPSLEIVDGVRGGGVGFLWLPPIVTTPPTTTGTFDNSVLHGLEVELCEFDGSTCVSSGFKRIFTSATGGFFDRVKLFSNQQYQVMYASATDNLDPAKDYRLTVRAFDVALGFADIDVVASLAELQAVDRSRFATLFRGQSLPISFRINDVFPAACSAADIDALSEQVLGVGAANENFRAAIRRLAYLHRFGTIGDTEDALRVLADELSALANAAASDPPLLALIEQLQAALYCVVDRTVPPPPIAGTITGTITGTNGRGPLNAVAVRVDPAGLSATSDATGRYTIVNVPAGPATLLVSGGLPTDCTVPPPQNAVASAGSLTVDFEVQCGPGEVSVVPSTLVAGDAHACGLTTDGAAYCWGNNGPALGNGSLNGSTVPVPVSGGLTFETLSAGTLSTCGVTPEGAAYCWGTNLFGQIGDGTIGQRLTPVAVSGGLTFATISAGYAHTCGITRTGDAYCWGLNQQGRLGDGTTTNRLTPVPVIGGHKFVSLAASRSNVLGQGHSCGVTTDGEVYCWGNNTNFQLGTDYRNLPGNPTQSSEPLKVQSSQRFTSVVAGTLHTCALATDGGVYCWGFGPSYAPIFGSTTPREAGEGRSFVSIAAGIYHTCALTAEGAAYCFGVNSSGELGDGTSRTDGGIGNPPKPVSGGLTFASLAAGNGFTCGVTDAGSAFCWGAGSSGELGDGTRGRRLAPVPVLGGLAFSTLSSGGEHNCGLTSDGRAYCWGANGHVGGRLGDGTQLNRHEPQAVTGGIEFRSIVAAPLAGGETMRNAFSCGLSNAGETYCWGGNFSQQLGIPGGNRLSPQQVVGAPAFEQLALGAQHACARTAADETYCWGGNFYGMLGRGGIGGSNQVVPESISGGNTFTTLVAGAYHTCGLEATGAAYCWGRNNRGQLGDGTSGTDRSEPVSVVGGLTFVSLAAGFEHTCGVAASGSTYCWGYGNFGQLGNGTTGPTNVALTPVLVSGGHSFASLVAGYYHTCGVTSTGSALCWGWNQDGQLGDGTIIARTTPVQVAGGVQFLELHAGRSHSCGLATSGDAFCWGWAYQGRVGDEYIRQVAGGLAFRRP